MQGEGDAHNTHSGESALRGLASDQAQDQRDDARGNSGQSKAPARRPTNRVGASVLFVAIAGAPLPIGSRDPVTVAFWCGLLALGLLFASTRNLRAPHFWLLAGIGGIIAGYGFVLHEQLAAHPWVAQPNPIWARTAELLGRSVAPSVSIVRDEPYYALGAPLAALLALILGLVVGAERQLARQALIVCAWAGIGYAAYGILSLTLDPTTILWKEKTAYLDSLTATFINRNAAAAYFGSCTVVWLLLLMESVRGRLPRGPIVWRETLDHLLTDMPAELMLRFAMVFVCLTALFMTGSRGGTLVSLLGLAIAFVLYFRPDLPRGKSLVVAFFAAVAVGLVLLQFLAGNIGARIDAGGLSDAGRLSAWRSTLRIIADNPWFGTGLGTFSWAFPPYRAADISMVGVWDRAHSTPLELAAELGIPLASLVALAWLVALVVLARALRGSRRDVLVPLVAFTVSLIALLHSSFDFSLQIPGYAIVVFAILGVGLGQSFNGDEDTTGERRRRRTRLVRQKQSGPSPTTPIDVV